MGRLHVHVADHGGVEPVRDVQIEPDDAPTLHPRRGRAAALRAVVHDVDVLPSHVVHAAGGGAPAELDAVRASVQPDHVRDVHLAHYMQSTKTPAQASASTGRSMRNHVQEA